MKKKVWLITGVSKGLGKALAEQIMVNGDIVIGTVRKTDDKSVFEKRTGASAYMIDLSKTTQITTLIATIIKKHGQIDVLVNNAGFGAFGMIEEFEEEEIIHQFNVNFFSVRKL